MITLRIMCSLRCCCAALLWLSTCRLAPPTSCSPPPLPVVIWLAGGSSNSLDCSGGVAVTCSNASWSENWVRRSPTPWARDSSGSSDRSRFTAAKTKDVSLKYVIKCDFQCLRKAGTMDGYSAQELRTTTDVEPLQGNLWGTSFGHYDWIRSVS